MRALAAMAAVVAVIGTYAATPASARVRTPELICSEAGGFGFAIAGQRGLSCIYYRADDMVEFYVGSSDTLGMELGPNNARRLAFRVGGADLDHPGELAGKFVGAQVGATIGFGLSAEGLMGGETGKVVLVPSTNQEDTGINVSAGLGVFNLRYAGSERRTLHERY